MAVLHMDPSKLESVIQNIRNLADECDAAKSRIDSEFEAEHDPMDIEDFPPAADKVIGNLNGRADTLEEAKNAIVAVNESGVGSMNADGVITYNLPDTVTISSVSDLSSLVQAEIDAEKAKNADPDELLDLMNGSVADHQNDEVYAAAFADAMGPEGMADLAYAIDKHRQSQLENVPDYDPNDLDTDYSTRLDRTNDAWLSAQATLSICFGTATSSSAWTPQHRSEYAEELAELVTDEDQPYYMPLGFNLLLEGANRTAANTAELDGEAVQAGGVFNKYFLQELGYAVEAHEKTCEGYPVWQSQRMNAPRPKGPVGDWDPMTGILTAMGRQPDAALDFLAPPVDDRAIEQTVEVDGTTWEWLKDRDWDSTSFEALSAAFAGASEHRQLTTGTKDERAAWITEQAVVDMAGREDGLWTDTSRQNAAVVLANSMHEIDQAASGRDDSQPPTRFLQDQPTRWDELHWDEIRLLLQETLKDDVALLTVSDAAGRYTSQRLDSSLDELPADATYQDAYDQVSQTRYYDGCLLGYIQGAAEKGRGDEAAEKDATNQMILGAFGKGLSFIPGPQSAVASKALSIVESYMLDAGGDALPSNSEQAKKDAKDMQTAVKDRLFAETYAKLDERGYLPAGAYTDPSGKPYDYTWMDYDNQDGSHVNEEELLSSPENIAKFKSWIADPDLSVVSNEAREPSTEGFEHGREKGLE
ncbi:MULTISPECIES: DUF6571 family protein [unclassified Actinomyces]|uniref:DUF6571 family protein n=1 Tax=unclassified Actinomyces TaxID=2609248 RepID=UPI000D5A2220|nr:MULTISPECIES: DUF6571 family protein [unclassified Actinomyces]RAX21084.1 hypothetical protein DRB07_12300 [Actinomyces sp. Z3]